MRSSRKAAAGLIASLWVMPLPEESDCGCEFHTWQRAADKFIRLIDEDWYRVADFYRELGGDEGGEMNRS